MNRIFVSLCFLLLACGEVVPVDGAAVDAGDNTGNDGGVGDDAGTVDVCAGPEIALENMETCFLRSQCEFMVRCLPGFPDVAFCESRLFDFFASLQDGSGAGGGGGGDDGPTKLLFETFRKAAMTPGVATYDGAKAFSCVNSLRDASCKNDGNNPDCELILTGDTPENGACFDDFECLPGARCERDTNNPVECSIVGQCRMGAGLGANCNNTNCQSGLECVYPPGVAGGVSGICQDGSLGSLCSNNFDCNSETYCSAGMCVAARASGAPCTDSDQCGGDQMCVNTFCADVNEVNDPCNGVCHGNLYCSENTLNCQPMPAMNENCSQVPATSLNRCNNVDFTCGGPLTNCVPRIPLAAPCPGGTTLKCALGSFCEAEFGGINMPKCVAPQAANERCNVAKHCDSGFCDPSGGSNSCQDFVACWED